MGLTDNLSMDIYQLFEEGGLLVKVEKGNHIFHEGESAGDLFLIKNGSVQISKETEHGKELTFRVCGKNSIIGESSLFGPTTFHSNTAKAIINSEIIILNKNTLEMILTEQPSLMIEYLKWIQNENLKNQSLIRDLVIHGKRGALFSTLIRLSNTYGEPINEDNNHIFINLHLTNSEVANLCSTSREMINRMLNELKKLNIITFEKGYITILDLNYLKEEIACENCPATICRID
ncbi:Crp/Fnr family transcriptional regulator [Lysinibacillus sp. SGAir0095]|uniref:Crp/Fnr family transcriptional regulator n=1 Tax=Lysinibacillus sp. SGAir0095 TaxID=2070463 RepID=UPI0010CD696D|nr:Crp/Fnr family transcriptional regulator [Lysinibacillus sp. SGAir0095]QCR31580.1 Crp/Fnr family transcriptional regulator [Lysinibacillus sp. SGAir0095]